jgi:hypothetical protein
MGQGDLTRKQGSDPSMRPTLHARQSIAGDSSARSTASSPGATLMITRRSVLSTFALGASGLAAGAGLFGITTGDAATLQQRRHRQHRTHRKRNRKERRRDQRRG